MTSNRRRSAALLVGLPIVFSLLLPTQAAAAPPPEAGRTYEVGRQLYSSGTWSLTLETIAVSETEMTVNVLYRNVGSAPATLHCPSPTGNVITVGRETLLERDSYCATRSGQQWSVAPGAELVIWGVFPKLDDVESRFSLTWYNWGTTRDISLLPYDPNAGPRAAQYCIDAIVDELRNGAVEITVPGGDKIVKAMSYTESVIEVEYHTRAGDVENALYSYAEFFALIVGELNSPTAQIFSKVAPAYLSCVKAAQYYLQEKAKETARDLRSWYFGAPSPPAAPRITGVEVYTEGALVHLRATFDDPDGDAEGFGFRGANGAGWAEESHPFTNPSYGRVGPGRIDYPFNHGCGTGNQMASDVEMWIYDSGGRRSPSIVAHLVCP